MPTKPVEIDIGDIDTCNLETPEPTPEDTALQPVAQNAIEFPNKNVDVYEIPQN